MEKDILKDLKEIQKFLQENEFKQEGSYSDAGFFDSGVFIRSKPVKSRINKLINKILKSDEIK